MNGEVRCRHIEVHPDGTILVCTKDPTLGVPVCRHDITRRVPVGIEHTDGKHGHFRASHIDPSWIERTAGSVMRHFHDADDTKVVALEQRRQTVSLNVGGKQE